jgi:hypothetical protein
MRWIEFVPLAIVSIVAMAINARLILRVVVRRDERVDDTFGRRPRRNVRFLSCAASGTEGIVLASFCPRSGLSCCCGRLRLEGGTEELRPMKRLRPGITKALPDLQFPPTHETTAQTLAD